MDAHACFSGGINDVSVWSVTVLCVYSHDFRHCMWASVGVGGYFTLAMWLNLDLIYNNDSNDGGNQGIITFGGQGGGSSNVWSLIHHHGEGNELQFWMHNAHPSKPSVWSNNYYS